MDPSPQTITLQPVRTSPDKPEYQALLSWEFEPEPFYQGQIPRLLQSDIPHCVSFSSGFVWVYRDADNNTVGFGTLDVCKEYERFTDGKPHAYIPLLAVHPNYQGRGHGRRIVDHLIGEAVLFAGSGPILSDRLFLDVYTMNILAIGLYQKFGFAILNPNNPIPDPEENNEPYFIMARSVSVSSASGVE